MTLPVCEYQGMRTERDGSRESSVILNLGCGNRKTEGEIGVDVVALDHVDIVHDLNVFPYPFPDNYADSIVLSHILEHLDDVVKVMEEVWRISKPHARINIRVPHYSGIFAWRDPSHRRSFTSSSFDYFEGNVYSYVTNSRFAVKKRLLYHIEKPDRLLLRCLGRIVQYIFDKHPTFSERYLCYIIGGIDEVQFVLEAEK